MKKKMEMTNMEMSDKQLAVINKEIKNTVVFASAGAGKTTVLIDRLVKLIVKDRIKLSQIVAITFTDAASMELKSRLKEELEKEDNNDDFIINQIAYLPNANISTIHSFFLDIIKKYFYLLNIDENRLNNLLTDINIKELKDEAFDYILNNYEINKINRTLSDSLDDFRVIRETLDFMFEKANSNIDPISWLNKQKENRKSISKEIYDNYLLSIKKELVLAFESLDDITIENSDCELSRQKNLLKSLIDTIDKLNEGELNDEYVKEFNDFIDSTTELIYFKKNDHLKGNVDEETSNSFDLKAYKNQISKIASKLIRKDNYTTIFNEETNQINELLDLTIIYYNKYQELKAKSNSIDFDDFEHLAYQILTNYPYVVDQLKKSYKQIMVDEFQDTSNSQWAIINLISDNNLFIVGDKKQSIYRFRQANPEIMTNLRNNPSFTEMTLDCNYRSLPSLIDFNNDFYNDVMNKYEKDSFDKSIDSQSKDPSKVDDGNTHIRIVNSYEDENSIKDIYEHAYLEVLRLRSKSYNLSDIAVLTKNNDVANKMAKYFTEKNIACYVSSNESCLRENTFIPLKSIINLMIDDKDMVSRFSVLTSRFIGLSYDKAIKLKDKNYKLDKLEDIISQSKKEYKENGLFGFINYLLTYNNYYFNLSPQDKANYDYFIQIISSLNLKTIYELKDYIDSNSGGKEKPLIYTSEEKNVLPIMTIHKSKGLGFKNVILIDYTSGNNNNLDRNKLVFNSSIGFGLKKVKLDKKIDDQTYSVEYNSITNRSIEYRENYEETNENLRLLYVATTRPKENLIVICKSKEKKNSNDYFNPVTKCEEYTYNELFKNIRPSLFMCKFDTKGKYLNYKQLIKDDYSKYLEYEFKENNENIVKYEKKEFSKEELYASRASEHDYSEFNFGGGTNFGTAVHEYFESIVKNKKLDKANKEEINKSFSNYSYSVDGIIKAVDNFINSDLIKNNLDGDFNPEYPYINSDTYITSIIDLFIDTKDKVILIDYKTDSKTEDELIKNYTNQLEIYSKELYKKFNKPIEAHLYSIKLAKFIKLSVNYK